MKKFKFFSLAFAALMLGACSSDDIAEGPQSGPEWNAEGQGYINLAINLPSQPASRVNDEYDDGTPEEYDVKDATLILFSDGKVNSAYSMDLNFALDGSSDNITTTARITQQINSMTGTIEALVVLNNNGVFTVGEGGALTVGGAPMADKSLDELNKAISDNIGTNRNWHNNGFLMSNAVLATAPGGANASTGSAKTLVPIDATKICDTEAEASNNPAANIYVERAEAKVTVTNSLTGTTTDGSNMAYEIDGWCLDNTNNTSKLVRTVNGFDTWKGLASNAVTAPADLYRFVGSTPVGTNVAGNAGNETYYRIYWGDDYNYSSTATGALTTVGGQTVADGSLIKDIDGNTPDYCFENTTDLATMRENNCTRVVVKASFNGGNPFYTIDGDRAKVWTAEDAEAEAASRIVADLDFQAWARTNVQAGQTLLSTDLEVTLSNTAGDATVTAVTLTEAGQAKLNADANFATANAVALGNENIDLKYYANGEAYYSVWVSHFGEDGTPWNGDEAQTPAVGNIYPGGDANYLGRWGMLRNNWYEVELTGIRSLGEPTVSEATGDTIDKLESFISARINVLSWTKREQSAEL